MLLCALRDRDRPATGAPARCHHQPRPWVTRVARNFASDLEDAGRHFQFLLRDRDTKFTARFDAVLASVGIDTIRTAVASPRANASPSGSCGPSVRNASTTFSSSHADISRPYLSKYIRHYKRGQASPRPSARPATSPPWHLYFRRQGRPSRHSRRHRPRVRADCLIHPLCSGPTAIATANVDHRIRDGEPDRLLLMQQRNVRPPSFRGGEGQTSSQHADPARVGRRQYLHPSRHGPALSRGSR
jgi:hypothetical protein